MAQGLVINVVDAAAPAILNQVKGQDLKGILIPFYPVSNRIPALIDVVIKAANGPRSIAVLRLWGHGTLEPHPGGQAVLVNDDPGGGFDLEMMLRPSTQAALPRLRPYFAPGARVELKHCRVATQAGWDWISNLAQHWGVEIHASENLQQLVSWSGTVYSFRAGQKPVKIRGIDP